MTDAAIRRICGEMSHLLGLDYDESEQIHLSKMDLYDIVDWYTDGELPRGGRSSYTRIRLERVVEEALGFDRRSSPPYFIEDEYETMLTIIRSERAARRGPSNQPATGDVNWVTGSELAEGDDA